MAIMDERRKQILEEVIQNGTASVKDLAAQFNVTYETIRKDLAALADQNQLIKTHGGALAKQGSYENPFNVREEENIFFKKLLAKRAISLIPNGATIILGTGSTILELAKLLVIRNDLKIFTDSIPAVSYLQDSANDVYLFGGKLRSRSSSVYGGWTDMMLNQIEVDACFLGTDGFAGFTGPTSPSYSDASVDRVIINRSRKRYVLADYTKFKRKSLYQITNWDPITGLITNPEADNELVEKLAEHTTVIAE
ncbi:MAG: DeoR/GlpR family DNA-binding transcription regulator [Lacticaseibacillus paracasei]